MTYSCEKKIYGQCVEFFKENNPRIMKSIKEHRDTVFDAGDDKESKLDSTQENSIKSEDDNNVDYNFFYENNPK